MYSITVFSTEGVEVAHWTEPEQIDYREERKILRGHPDGYYLDISRVIVNPASDEFAAIHFELEPLEESEEE